MKKFNFLSKLTTLFLLLFLTAFSSQAWGGDYEELFTISSGSVVSNSAYNAYSNTVDERDWVITFGGNNSSVGTNKNNRSSCTLGDYSKYAVSPVTTSDIASAFVSTTSISDVSKISYTFSGGSNQTNTNVYLIYSSDNTTFSQVSLTSGTQGAAISSGTAYEFTKCSGYFGLLFKATNSSDAWRIDGVSITFYTASATCSSSITITKGVDPANGTFTLSNSGSVCIDDGNASATVTATPITHYHLATVTTSASGSVGSISGNICTVSDISANTTINVTFAEDTKHTVTWSVNGNESTTSEVYDGEKPTLPSEPSACDPTSTTFIGWSTTAWGGKIDDVSAKNIYTSADDMPAVTASVTYYAVWAKADTGEGTATDTYDFESAATSPWTNSFSTLTESQGVDDSKAGSITASGQVSYGNKVAVSSFSFSIKRASSNTNGTVYVDKSTDNSEWTSCTSYGISDFSNGSYTTKTYNSFDGEEYYVRVRYNSTGNAQRYIDNVSITYGGGITYSEYLTSCGATINALSDYYITSTQSQNVKIVIPVSATNFESASTLSANISGAGFSLVGWTNKGITADVDLNTEVVVQYCPTTYNTTNNATLTLSTVDPAVTKTVTIHGRSLPQEFAIIGNTGNTSTDNALPANMDGSAPSRIGQQVTISSNQVQCASAVFTYTLEGVTSGRYAAHGTAVRLKGYTTGKYLKAVTSDHNALQNSDYSDDDMYEWILITTNHETYNIVSHNSTLTTGENRAIRYRSDGHFGNYTRSYGGEANLKIVEVAADCRPMNVSVSDITHNSVKINFEGTATSHTLVIKQGSTTVVNKTVTNEEVVSSLSAEQDYTYTLTPSCSANCAVDGEFSTVAAPITVVLSRDGKTEDVGEVENPYTLPATVVAPCEGWTFDGWSKTAVTDGSTSYTKVTKADATGTYYAVYKKSGGSVAYTKVTSDAGLVSGKNYVIGYYKYDAVLDEATMHVAGAISSDVMQDVTDNTTADGSEITALSSSAEVFTLGGSSGAWTFTSMKGVLGATAAKKLAYDSGTKTWSISISSGEATIGNTNDSYGTLYFNSGSPRFTTYTSSQTTPSLYIQGGGYTYSSTTDCKECSTAGASFSLGDIVNKSTESADFTNTVTYIKTNGKTQTWTSSNTSVATVNATSGLVHIVGLGTTTISLTQALDDTNDPDNVCAVKISYVLNVNPPAVDVVEVTADDKIIIEHDIDDSNSQIVVQEQETGISGSVAKDIFFSKYFEAASNLKLFALYNGTKKNIDLSKLRVRASSGSSWGSEDENGHIHGWLELGSISKLGEDYPDYLLPPFTEIILWSNNHGGSNAKLRECVNFKVNDDSYEMDDLEAGNVPNWYCIGSPTTYLDPDKDGNYSFTFNGPNSLILERTEDGGTSWTPIDLFGAVDNSGNPITTSYTNQNQKPSKAEWDNGDGNGLIKKATANGSTVNDNEKYTINNIDNMPLNDDPGGFWAMADYDDDSEIPLSTNRYYLTRLKTVEDGSNAIALNINRFATLITEWTGKPIGGAKSDATSCYSGEMFSEVGSYDYSHYFTTWNEVSLEEEDFEKLGDGTYAIKVDDLAGHSCKTLRIKVTDKTDPSIVKASVDYKVPIIVKNGTKNTNDPIFTGDGFGSEVCTACDVVVLNGATLEASTELSAVKEVRNVEIYAGGTLNIDGSKELTVNQLIMRSKDDVVSRAKLPSANFTRRNKTILFDKRITGTRWYWLSLPYDWNIDDVTFRNGEQAKYNVDWWLRTYNGEQRATGDESKETNWTRVPDHSTLKAGVGYIVAVNPISGHTYGELRFPMTATLVDKDRDVTVPVKAWGATTSVAPNHLGWNLVGNPYLNDYEYSGMPDILTIGELVYNSSTGLYELDKTGGLRYVVESENPSGYGAYKQVALADNKLLEPFKAYFVQIDGTSAGQSRNIEFTYASEHMRKSPVRRAPKDYLEEAVNDIVWVPVNLTNVSDEVDETTILVSNRFSDNYDMMDDLSKWRRAYYEYYGQPILASRNKEGEMAFNALSDSSAMAGIPLNYFAPTAGMYTLSLNKKYGVQNIKEAKLYDSVAKKEHDLKSDGEYMFSTERTDNTSRFVLYLTIERQNVPTGLSATEDGNEVQKILYNGQIYILRSGKVFDITGKQVR